jgi:hypothetical protein
MWCMVSNSRFKGMPQGRGHAASTHSMTTSVCTSCASPTATKKSHTSSALPKYKANSVTSALIDVPIGLQGARKCAGEALGKAVQRLWHCEFRGNDGLGARSLIFDERDVEGSGVG